MQKVEVPLDYKPKFELCFRGNRNRYFMTYLLPDCSTKISVTLPPEIKTKEAAEKFKDRKNTDLLKGILNDREYERYKEAHGNKIVSFDEGFNTYLTIDTHIKGKKTQEMDAYCVQKSLQWFKDLEDAKGKKVIRNLNDVEQDHIIKYRSFLLSEATLRKGAEENFRKKSDKIKDATAFDEMKKITKSVGISFATAETKLRRLFTFFNKLKKNKVLTYNPCEEVQKITPKKSDRVRSTSPTTREIGQILEARYEHPYGFPLKKLIIFLAETGARWGEALHLEFTDIENGIWKIREKPMCPTKYGMGWVPKCDGEREVALTPKALAIIEEIKAEVMGQKIVGYIKGEKTPYRAEFVFTIKDYGRFNDGGRRRMDSARNAWVSLLKAANVRTYNFDSICFHDFRRYRNEMNDKIKGLSAQERGRELGNSEGVNKSHYTGQLDDELLQMAAQMKALRQEIIELREENQALKSRSA